ncbi:MAG: hypothetical protein LUG17_01710, partial [Clostridiales bacterium]|nr:hypothetical protein [Clostridiales bacterium]
GKVDPLTGLKENVIIGKLIPAGTGMDQFRCDDQISDDGNVISQEEPAPADEDLFVEEDAAPVEAVPVGSDATV